MEGKGYHSQGDSACGRGSCIMGQVLAGPTCLLPFRQYSHGSDYEEGMAQTPVDAPLAMFFLLPCISLLLCANSRGVEHSHKCTMTYHCFSPGPPGPTVHHLNHAVQISHIDQA